MQEIKYLFEFNPTEGQVFDIYENYKDKTN